MKKYVAAILISISITGLLTGCGNSQDIGKDKATEIALESAKLTEADVTGLRVSKDKNNGESIYEVEFTSGNTEYEYEILASNGDILSFDHESKPPASPNPDKQQEQKDTQVNDGHEQTGNAPVSPSDVKITLEEASQLALGRVPGALEQDLKIELDYDDGRQTYEGDIIYGQKEYEFEIDADSGEFLEWKEERR